MIPKEIDELMWTIAEGGDSHAISEFGDRYPNLREELLKRLKTVQALKAGGRTVKPGKVPTFRNARVQPVNWKIAFATFGVTILAVTAFGIWKLTYSPPQLPPVTPVNTAPAQLPQANIPIQQEDLTPHPSKTPPIDQGFINPPVIPNTTVDTSPKRTSLEVESAGLHAAITLIAEAGRMQVTIAPGTPDPTVRVNFHDMTPMDMLKELGKEYAFDTLLDGEHSIMIIPKKDEEVDQMTNETR